MRIIITLLFVVIIFIAHDVNADDEFGERFYNQTPKGMADYTVPEGEASDIAMDNAAEDLQDIMPAAGMEDADSSKIKDPSAEDHQE